MIGKSAKTIDDLRKVVDSLESVIKKGLSATTERELSEADHQIGVAFRGLQYNVMTVANETRKNMEAHRVSLRYRRAPVSSTPAIDTHVPDEQPKKDDESKAKKSRSRKAKK